MRTWIKICGTTLFEDAQASIEAGADALGFIFAPSRRRISTEQARQIVDRLPGEIERIGIFVNETQAQIEATVDEARLTGIQLHGNETPEFIGKLFSGRPPEQRIKIIKTVLAGGVFEKQGFEGGEFESQGFEGQLERLNQHNGLIDHILLDSGSGSGKTFDWQRVQPAMRSSNVRFIVAGGLNQQNVGEAVQTLRPWGVDAVSGVEREPGRKDPEKLKAFIAAVRKAEQS